jgi:RNA recognition motif-containing protein
MNLFVGNLSPETTEADLRNLFTEFGEIVALKVVKDLVTGDSRGFGFVEYADKFHAYDAIDNIDMTFFQGNVITVKEAKPKANERPGGGGGFKKQRPRNFTPSPGGSRNAFGGGERGNSFGGGERPARFNGGGERGNSFGSGERPTRFTGGGERGNSFGGGERPTRFTGGERSPNRFNRNDNQ